MRLFVSVIVFILLSVAANAQHKRLKKLPIKLANSIDNKDRRKIEKAKKLLNAERLFKGEQLLIKLRDDNMNQAYFHEALVQVQMQILNRMALEHPPTEDEGELFIQGAKQTGVDLTLEENFIDNGLARTEEEQKETVNNIRLARSDRKKLKNSLKENQTVNEENTVLNPVEAARLEMDKINAKEQKKATQKKLVTNAQRKIAQEENDFLLIPYATYAQEIIKNARLASLKHERVDSASHYLRTMLIDTINYDEKISAEELETMEGALDYYYAGDYVRSTVELKKITSKYADYFPAHLYLANCYFNMGLDTPTFKQYVYITQNFSERPEGFEGLSKYYLATGKYTEASACIIKAILIYPEDGYFFQLHQILKRSGHELNTHWVRREVYPISSNRNYEEIIAPEDSPWRFYQNAKSMVYSYAKDGILRFNEITHHRYMELYAWEEMLAANEHLDSVKISPKKRAELLAKNNQKQKENKKAEKINFPFARSMQKMGYLDCYVFVSLFHHDLYEAFKDFVILNPDKVEKYFYILLNWEDEKFDKFRISEKPPGIAKELKEKKKPVTKEK